MSLPHFREFGWQPYVLAVAPSSDQHLEPILEETVPSDVLVERVRPIPSSICRPFGLGNIALRSLPFLYWTGSRLIAKHRIDLVYFSTTMFWTMPLGRLWRRRFGVPYVLDIQDPWLSDYYEQHPASAPPPKYAVARRVHAVLEPWTMKEVGALIAVSDDYVASLRRRYPWIGEDICSTLPFGASSNDFALLERRPQPNRVFQKQKDLVHGVYVGRGGDDMRPALRILLGALRSGLAAAPDVFRSVRLHFVGTDYATDARARETVRPVAQEQGVGDLVSEQTSRVPYFEALQLLKDADFLIVIGSDDPAYTASKVYPYLMAGRPILAIVHERSGLVRVLKDSKNASLVTFGGKDEARPGQDLLKAWRAMMDRFPVLSSVDENIDRYSAREMTRRQCAVFDETLAKARLRAA